MSQEAASSTPPSKSELPKAAGKPDFGASSHYKLNIRRGAKLPFKAQSLSSPSRHMDKSLMFEGLDDLETSGGETFKPRKNIKKLVIQPSSSRPVSQVTYQIELFLYSNRHPPSRTQLLLLMRCVQQQLLPLHPLHQ